MFAGDDDALARLRALKEAERRREAAREAAILARYGDSTATSDETATATSDETLSPE